MGIDPIKSVQPVDSEGDSTALERFDAHLAQALSGTALDPQEPLRLAEERLRFSYTLLAKVLAEESKDLKAVLERCLGKAVNSLCILPVPSYIEEHLDSFEACFESLVLVDNGKAAADTTSRRFLRLEELQASKTDFDAYLIPTHSGEIAALFRAAVPEEKVVCFDSFAAELMRSDGEDAAAGIDAFIERVRLAPRPLVVVVGIYLNSYTPTFEALAEQGCDVFVVARSNTLYLHAGHVRSIDGALPFADVLSVDHWGMLHFLSNLDVGVVFMAGAEDSFVAHGFSCRRSASCYAYVAALAKMASVPVILALYDVVKPVTRDLEYERDAMLVYGRMLSAASKLSLGANTVDAGEFAIKKWAPGGECRAFYRYAHCADDLQQPLQEGFHLVVVGGMLGEGENPYWLKRKDLRKILQQGIHLHVYSSSPVAQRFRSSLDEQERDYLHLHASIEDQRQLLHAISQYHAGFLLNDTDAIAAMIRDFQTDFGREIVSRFWESMVSSAAMLFGCAGLPMILNRSSIRIREQFPEEYFLPTEIEELDQLKQRLAGVDWERLRTVTIAERGRFSIEAHAGELNKWIGSLMMSPSASPS